RGRQWGPSLEGREVSLIALRFAAPGSALGRVDAACGDWGESLALTEVGGGSSWAVEVLFTATPEESAIRDRLGGVGVSRWSLEPVVDRDWVSESQRLLPEFRAGRFFIY